MNTVEIIKDFLLIFLPLISLLAGALINNKLILKRIKIEKRNDLFNQLLFFRVEAHTNILRTVRKHHYNICTKFQEHVYTGLIKSATKDIVIAVQQNILWADDDVLKITTRIAEAIQDLPEGFPLENKEIATIGMKQAALKRLAPYNDLYALLTEHCREKSGVDFFKNEFDFLTETANKSIRKSKQYIRER